MEKTDLLCLQTKAGFFGIRFSYKMKGYFMKKTESSLQERILLLSDPKKIRAEITTFLAYLRLSFGSITRVKEIIFEDPSTPKS